MESKIAISRDLGMLDKGADRRFDRERGEEETLTL